MFAAVERISKFEQSTVILSDRDDEMSAGVELTESELVVVLVVEDVEEGREEGVKILSSREEMSCVPRKVCDSGNAHP